MKKYLRLSTYKKFNKFTGHWKKNGNNYDGKFMVHLESNYFDLEGCNIKWGFIINNVSVNHDKVGKDIFVPFNAESTDYIEPKNAFKIKGEFPPFGSLKISATINNETTVEIDYTTEGIIEYGLKSHVEEYIIKDEEEPEPIDPEIPTPNIEPIIEGNIFKELFNKYKWYGVVYLAGLLTPIVFKIIGFIGKIF